jgi:carboxypeptidase family protein
MPRWLWWTLGIVGGLALLCVGAFLLVFHGIRVPMSDSVGFLEDPRPASVVVTVLLPDARPAAGVRVEAEHRARPAGPPLAEEAADGPTASATTDNAGHAELRGLGLGTWAITVRAPGCAAAGTTVRGGNNGRKRLDLLLCGAHALRGRVVDDDGTAVSTAEVRAGREPWSSATTTGADGRFVLEGVPVGVVELLVRRDGTAPASGGRFRVPSDDEVELVVAPPRALPGIVTDSKGTPVAGASVALQLTWPIGPAVTATTGPDGRFTIPLTLAAGGAHAIVRDASVTAPNFCIARFSETSVYVAPGSTDLLTLELVPACAVTGLVADVSGAAAGARVDVTWDWKAPNGTTIFGSRETVADAKGNFRIDGVPAARLGVRAQQAPPGRSAAMTFVTGTAGAAATARVLIPPDPVVRTAIRGTVTSPAGPVDRATVTVMHEGDSGPEPIAEGSTAPDGTFAIDDVPAELEVWLSFHAAGLRPFETGHHTADEFAGPETFPLAAGVTIDGTLRGPGGAPLADARVWAVPGDGRDAFSATWAPPGLEDMSAAAPDGRYVTRWCGSGTTRVCATAAGLAPSVSGPFSIAILDGAPHAPNVNLKLDEGATFRGRLLDPDGKPLANRPVALRPVGTAREAAVGFGRTDAEGRFTIRRLAKGPVVVTPVDRRSAGFRGVRVVPGDAPIDVRLRRPGPNDQAADDDR